MTGIFRSRLWAPIMLAGLAILAYLPALSLPFIADDYVQIRLARDYGPVSGWAALALDPLYRCRATSLVLTYWTDRVFGLAPLAYNCSSLLLHVFNTWLVFALGAWRVIGWRVSAVAAAFFAVYEGHQEAVTWYAAVPDLLVFFFSLLCLIFWILWLQSSAVRFGRYAASIVCFFLALASKESAVAVVAILPLALWFERNQWRRRLLAVVPFAGLAVIYTALVFAARSNHLHFQVGAFSLQAPFLIVLVRSTWRLFWFWGLLSLLALAILRVWCWRPLVVLAFAWIGITFLPYSFLTYMPRVPSRHTYFASAGLALVVASGFLVFRDRFHRSQPWAPVAVAALMLVHNCGYLWTKKQAQYLERAAPTEALIEFVRKVDGPVYLHCFPYSIWVAQWAVEVRLNKEVYPIMPGRGMAEIENKSNVFCWGHRGDPSLVNGDPNISLRVMN